VAQKAAADAEKAQDKADKADMKAAAVAQKAAAVAQKAQDKADRKAAAAAQTAAAVVQARTQQQEYVGWWAKCEDCGRWRVTRSTNWAERDFHCGDNKMLWLVIVY
jgi:hypothetical protein